MGYKEEGAAHWGNNVGQRMSRRIRWTENFMDYKTTVVSPFRAYIMQERQKAPKNSNVYFEL